MGSSIGRPSPFAVESSGTGKSEISVPKTSDIKGDDSIASSATCSDGSESVSAGCSTNWVLLLSSISVTSCIIGPFEDNIDIVGISKVLESSKS